MMVMALGEIIRQAIPPYKIIIIGDVYARNSAPDKGL
jgi:hypothetical protein